MSSLHHDHLNDDGLAALGLFGLSEDVAGPILAGMRAQAIAGLCERLGLPAIFLDRDGRVLHMAPSADALIAGEVSTVADHLLGRNEEINRRIAKLLVTALDDREDNCPSGSIAFQAAEAPLSLTAIRAGAASAHQLLKVVLLVSRGAGVSPDAVRQVRSALAEL